MIKKVFLIWLSLGTVEASAITRADNSGDENKRSLRAVTGSGFTPLHEAARIGSTESASRLINEGHRVNTRVSISGVLDPNYDFVDDTPLDIAMAFGQHETAKFLRTKGGKTATEIEAARVNRITWGKPVQGLQIGVAIAIENDISEQHRTYLATYVRNSGTKPKNFLTHAPTGLEDNPQKLSLTNFRLKLYKLGGGDLIILSFRGENHSLPEDKNGESNQSRDRSNGSSPTVTNLPDDHVAKASLTLMPGQQIGPFSIRYGNARHWAPLDSQDQPDRKAQYAVAVLLDISDPHAAWKGTLTVTPLPKLRFPMPESKTTSGEDHTGDDKK